MIEFDKAREKALQELKLTYTVTVLNDREIKHQEFKKAAEAWSIQTEIFLPDESVRVIEIFCVLPEEFPLQLPVFYLSENDYEWIKYIPHVNTNRLVCLFDDESIIVNPERPAGIIKECIEKARSTLQDGLKEKNAGDFREEFLAYWEDAYDQKDEIIAGLSIVGSGDEITPGKIKLVKLNIAYQGYYYALVSDNKESLNYKNYLDDIGIQYEEHDVFFLGDLQDLEPPFFYDNEKVYELIKTHKSDLIASYKNFINDHLYPKVVLFDTVIKGRCLFFGCFIPPLTIKRNGFRANILSPFTVYNTYQKHDPVSRITFEEFTTKRLEHRTEGPQIKNNSFALTFSGLGSIGSNLLHYLYTSELKKLVLIDPETLTVANINRHLLGMSYVNYPKADALRHFFKSKNPLISIESYEASVISLIRNQKELFNDADYNFVAIGKDNIEQYIVDCLNSSVLLKPTFILWVEPYLCGGHCIYVNPGHYLDYSSLYIDNYYKFNVIATEEYLNPDRRLTFREAGCQSSYVPYGQKSILLFMASLMPAIFNVMGTNGAENLRFTWKGNEKILEELKLKTSKEADRIKFGELQISNLS